MADIAWMYSLADAWSVAGKIDESKYNFQFEIGWGNYRTLKKLSYSRIQN